MQQQQQPPSDVYNYLFDGGASFDFGSFGLPQQQPPPHAAAAIPAPTMTMQTAQAQPQASTIAMKNEIDNNNNHNPGGTSAGGGGPGGGRGGTGEFRRRRNWSERILNEITGIIVVLSPVGKIMHCSGCVDLTGYAAHELIDQTLMDFLHVDDIDVFIRDFNWAFHARSQIKTLYRFRKKDDTYTVLEMIGHPRVDIPGQSPQSFFAIAQPYPTRMGGLLDSFLELKMENEWLRQRLQEVNHAPLYDETDVWMDDPTQRSQRQQQAQPLPSTTQEHHQHQHHQHQQQQQQQQQTTSADYSSSMLVYQDDLLTLPSRQPPSGDVSPIAAAGMAAAAAAAAAAATASVSSAPTTTVSSMSTPAAAAGAAAAAAGTVSNTSTSADVAKSTAPNNATMATAQKDTTKLKRRKKQKETDDFVCTDCGTTSSPEWRKGPQGPKTLCNACGLRWAKRIKKKDGGD